MELYWNDVRITDSVNITGCVYRDTAGCGRDTLEITLDNAAIWYRWAPEEDDRIAVTYNDFSTGVLYLDTVVPDRDQYKVIATSVKRAGMRKAWECYQGMTLEEIADRCAGACAMNWHLYGLEGGLPYGRIERQHEGAAAFFNRVLKMEGAVLKAYNGMMRGISIPYAQALPVVQTFSVTEDQEGVRYQRRAARKLTALTVKTPYLEATARDRSAAGSNDMTVTHLPAADAAQAGRWARGLLINWNRKAEEISIEMGMNTGMTALARVDITGGTDADGEWMVQEAEHDFYNRRTSVSLYRVIDTVE